MTKQEIQEKYHALAAQTGDLYFRVENARKALAAMEDQLAACKRQKDELEEQYKHVKEDANEPAPVEATPVEE